MQQDIHKDQILLDVPSKRYLTRLSMPIPSTVLILYVQTGLCQKNRQGFLSAYWSNKANIITVIKQMCVNAGLVFSPIQYYYFQHCCGSEHILSQMTTHQPTFLKVDVIPLHKHILLLLFFSQESRNVFTYIN